MSEETHGSATPWWFWVISAVALIWNALGVMAYLGQKMSSYEDIVAMQGQEMADVIAAQPTWYTAAFAFAVFGGVLGALFLLLRKSWAKWAFLVSLIAVIAQQVYFIMEGIYGKMSGAELIMPISIPIIAIFLLWFSKAMIKRGILK